MMRMDCKGRPRLCIWSNASKARNGEEHRKETSRNVGGNNLDIGVNVNTSPSTITSDVSLGKRYWTSRASEKFEKLSKNSSHNVKWRTKLDISSNSVGTSCPGSMLNDVTCKCRGLRVHDRKCDKRSHLARAIVRTDGDREWRTVV